MGLPRSPGFTSQGLCFERSPETSHQIQACAGWGAQDSVQLPYKWLNSMVYGRYLYYIMDAFMGFIIQQTSPRGTPSWGNMVLEGTKPFDRIRRPLVFSRWANGSRVTSCASGSNSEEIPILPRQWEILPRGRQRFTLSLCGSSYLVNGFIMVHPYMPGYKLDKSGWPT